jgi:hypothetical protein
MFKSLFIAALSFVKAEDLLFAPKEANGQKLLVIIPGKNYQPRDFKQLSEALSQNAYVAVVDNTGNVGADVQRAIK